MRRVQVQFGQDREIHNMSLPELHALAALIEASARELVSTKAEIDELTLMWSNGIPVGSKTSTIDLSIGTFRFRASVVESLSEAEALEALEKLYPQVSER